MKGGWRAPQGRATGRRADSTAEPPGQCEGTQCTLRLRNGEPAWGYWCERGRARAPCRNTDAHTRRRKPYHTMPVRGAQWRRAVTRAAHTGTGPHAIGSHTLAPRGARSQAGHGRNRANAGRAVGRIDQRRTGCALASGRAGEGGATLKQVCSRVSGSARCVQRLDDSRSAFRITYRISLRSSSSREPRYPLLKVVCVGGWGRGR